MCEKPCPVLLKFGTFHPVEKPFASQGEAMDWLFKHVAPGVQFEIFDHTATEPVFVGKVGWKG